MEPSAFERPDWSALGGMVDDLRKTMREMDHTQRRIRQVTGTAWSGDRMVKAVVGPRGQLVELVIDPRVYRTPNSVELAASIVSTTRAAAEEALAQTMAIVDSSMPADLRTAGGGSMDRQALALTHDADLVDEGHDAGSR